MCPRRNQSDNSKRQERETRQQEKKSRDKKAHGKDDKDKAFKNYLQTYNLQLRNIIGDGNCLFRSCKLKIRLFFSLKFCLYIYSC